MALSSPGPHSNCRVVKDSRHFIDFVFVCFPQLVFHMRSTEAQLGEHWEQAVVVTAITSVDLTRV